MSQLEIEIVDYLENHTVKQLLAIVGFWVDKINEMEEQKQ